MLLCIIEIHYNHCEFSNYTHKLEWLLCTEIPSLIADFNVHILVKKDHTYSNSIIPPISTRYSITKVAYRFSNRNFQGFLNKGI